MLSRTNIDVGRRIHTTAETKASGRRQMRPALNGVSDLCQRAQRSVASAGELEADHRRVGLRPSNASAARRCHARVHDPAVVADVGDAREGAEKARARGPRAGTVAGNEILRVVKPYNALKDIVKELAFKMASMMLRKC